MKLDTLVDKQIAKCWSPDQECRMYAPWVDYAYKQMEKELYNEKIDKWESRDITAIEKCRSCELSLACGGGCGSVAFNQTGDLHSPDCNPVGRLLELGISQYFEKEQ